MPDFSKLLDFEGGPFELHPLDCVILAGVVLPLAELPDGGRELALDKKKSSGKDGHTLVGRAYQKDTIKIRLRLYKDRRRKDPNTDDYVDWLTIYYRDVHDKLLPDDPKKRDAVSIYHPFLAAEQIRSIVVTKRGMPKHEGRGIFTVEIVGEDPSRFKHSNKDGTHKPKGDSELKYRAAGNAAANNAQATKPSTAQKGKV